MIRLLRTVVTLRPEQVHGRLTFSLRHRRARRALRRLDASSFRTSVPWLMPSPPGVFEHGEDPAAIGLLNADRSVGWPPDWTADDAPLLWRFQLHGLEWLGRLRPALRRQAAFDWIRRNPPSPGPAWHPHPTSRRIAALLRMGLGSEPEVARSLYQQTAFLYRMVETHVLGNHLMDNARALVLAGSAFGGQGGSSAWLHRGLEIYREQIPQQILADGGHEERSPMYHALVLEGITDAVHALASTPGCEAGAELLRETALRMASAWMSWLLPDGRPPLFNDSAFGIAPEAPTLLRWVEHAAGSIPELRSAFPDTGIFVHRGDRIHMAWDAGPGGPRHLMAHAHADVFSFELALDGLRFVVDPGISTYERGVDRDFLRSTRAHSTVCIDGRNQFECWHAFRVARRAVPRDVSWRSHPGHSVFRGVYPWGEVHGGELSHERELQIDDEMPGLRIHDRVLGLGRRRVEASLPLAPEVKVALAGNEAELQRDGVRVALRTLGGSLRVEDRWVAPEFGLRIPAKALVLTHEAEPPIELVTEFRLVSAQPRHRP